MDRSRAGRGGHSRRGALHAKAKFLEFSSQYIESVQDPYQALGFAAIGIKELHRREGKPERAVEELEQVLATTKDRKARNVLLFVIRQVHESSQNKEGFMAVNQQIIEENLAAVVD